MQRPAQLTADQRLFATARRMLVYKFLNQKHLSEDEFYDIVIFGYLKAVQDYAISGRLRHYAFSTVAWYNMARCVYNHRRSQNCKKRKAEVLSLDAPLYEELPPLGDTVSDNTELEKELETRLLLHELAGRVSAQQLGVIRMKAAGYGIRAIAHEQKLRMERIKEILDEVWHIWQELVRPP